MVVAVVAVLVVQPVLDNVANVIAMRHGSMATVRTVAMATLVSTAAFSGARATRGVGAVRGQSVFRYRSIGLDMVQVPVV